MKNRTLTLSASALLFTILLHPAFAQHHAKYRAVIITTGNMKRSGDFISINDSLLVIMGPERADLSRKITTYKNVYFALKPHEIKSISINRKGGATIGAVLGGLGGGALGFKSAGNKVFNTGSFTGDIAAQAGYTVMSMIFGSILGSATGVFAGHGLSTRIKLKKLDLKDFSAVKNQLEPYQAKLKK